MDGPVGVPAMGGRTSGLLPAAPAGVLALVMFCCAGFAGNATALSGRGAGYQHSQHLRHVKAGVRTRELDELLVLSAAQEAQVTAALQRSTEKNAAPRIRALLTDRQRKIYDHTPKTAQE